MHVELSAETSANPQNAILSEPILIATGIFDDQTQLPPADGLFHLVGFSGGNPLLSLRRTDPPITLRYPPLIVPAVLCGTGGEKDAARFIEWMAAHDAPVPQVLEWRAGKEGRNLQRVVVELSRILERSTDGQARASGEAQRLRALNADMRYRFAVAEAALQRLGGVPLELAFVNDPAAEHSQSTVLNDTEAGISQILPRASAGVAAVAVHFANTAGEASAAELIAQLVSLEDGRTIERWTVPARAITPGWNLLGLTRAPNGQSRTIELRLSRAPGDDRLPPLSLGGGQPVPAFQVKDRATGQPALPNSLALQIWRSLPGVALPGWVDAHRPARSRPRSRGLVELPVSPAILRSAYHANAKTAQIDFPPVVAPPGETAVTCHPPSRGVSLGGIGGAVPGGAMRVSATVSIGNEKSRDVDFCLVAAADAEHALAICEGLSEPGAEEGFSGWIRASSRERKRLSVFREPGPDRLGLFVGTRMSRPGDNSYAWARFDTFTTMVRK
jgi:hypothetical protein